jgi:hypothetical protein
MQRAPINGRPYDQRPKQQPHRQKLLPSYLREGLKIVEKLAPPTPR